MRQRYRELPDHRDRLVAVVFEATGQRADGAEWLILAPLDEQQEAPAVSWSLQEMAAYRAGRGRLGLALPLEAVRGEGRIVVGEATGKSNRLVEGDKECLPTFAVMELDAGVRQRPKDRKKVNTSIRCRC